MRRRRASACRGATGCAALLVLALATLGSPSPAWAAAAAATPPVVIARQEVVFAPQGGGWSVLELLTVLNTGSATLTSLRGYVPAEASNLQLRGGVAGVRPGPGGAPLLTLSLPPGHQADVAFSYRLASGRLTLAWLVPDPVLQVVVLLPRGAATLSGPDFHADGTVAAGPLTFDAYLAATPSAGSVLHFTITRSGWLDWVPADAVPVGAGALALGLSVLVLVRSRRRRRGSRPLRRAPELVDAIAALDAAFRRHELGAETYRCRRAELMEQLLGRAGEDAPPHAGAHADSRATGG